MKCKWGVGHSFPTPLSFLPTRFVAEATGIDQIETKSKKTYLSNTVLLVEYNLDIPYYDGEWELLVGMVEDRVKTHPSKEIFLYDGIGADDALKVRREEAGTH